MDLRAYYIQAAEAAAAAVHADDDDDDDVTELTPKAVLLKLEVQAGTAVDVPASRKGSGLSPFGVANSEEAGMVVAAEGSGGRDLTCPECGKKFLSGRAMYGHLRSHPERGYKGATRPATAAGAAAVDGDRRPRKVPRKGKADGPWSKWPVTAKRGRASWASAAAATPSSSTWCSEEEEAAMILLEMAAGSRGVITASEAQHPRRPVRTTRDAGHQMPDVEQQPMLLDDDDRVAQNQTPPPELELLQLMPSDRVARAVAAHQVTVEDDSQQIVRLELSPQVVVETQATPEVSKELLEIPTEAVLVVVHGKSSTSANQQQAAVAAGCGAGGAKKQKKRRVLPDPERTPPPPGTAASPDAAADAMPRVAIRRIPSPASDKKHECTTCHKSFPTHQALGGHMSSHAKDAKHAARRDDDHPAVVAQAMRNILAHRKQKGGGSNGGGGGTGATAEGGVAGATQKGAVLAGVGPEGAVAGEGQERAVVGAVLDHHYVEPPAHVPPPPSPPEHVCPDCNKIFPSGQALGGHKRKHWYPEKKQAKAVLAAATQNFDLNELPTEGDEENQP